jgi:hypothetical protein
MISIMCVGALHLDGGTQSAARRRPSVLRLKGKALQCPAMINLPVQVRTSMAHRVATLLFSIAVIQITSIMGICNTCKVTGSRSILSKSRKSTPTDAHLSTARTDTDQPISMDQTVVMRLFRTAITLIIWSTGACIIRMEIIAMIMVLCLWSRTKSPRDENDTNAVPLRSLARAIARLAMLNEPFEENGAIVYRDACRLGCEGIVSKRLDSPYRSGRSAHWLKVKNPKAPAVKREAEEDWGRT